MSDSLIVPSLDRVEAMMAEKQNTVDDNLNTTDKTIVGAINEILPKATGVGKVDASSDGTGEIFNGYEGEYANVASGSYSHAEGANTTAEGNCAHAEGYSTTASGGFSHAEGYGTIARNPGEHAEGLYNKSYSSEDASVQVIHSVGIGVNNASRKNAHEIKYNGDHYVFGVGGFDGTNSDTAQTLQEVINSKQTITAAVGKIDSTSDGTGEIFNGYEGEYANVASGSYSHAEGAITTALGGSSHSEGLNAKASGNYSHAEGYKTNAAGDGSHAEGHSTTASGTYSHAEGNGTFAEGDASHAEGGSTTASGNHSHAEGWNTTASGYYSHAEGRDTTAEGNCAHAEGGYTQTFSSYEHAEGSYNKSYDSEDASVRVIHSVGIGSSNTDRKNAHEIKLNGNHYVYGVGGFDGTNPTHAQTLQEVINNKAEGFTAGTGLEMTPERVLNVTLDTTVFKVVSVLPDSPAVGDENKIHLVPAESTGTNNLYTEYVWVNSAWEILGEYTSKVDLTPYLTKEAASGTYATKSELTSGLAGKANTTHTHTVSQITDLGTTLSKYATTTALTEGLAGKANKSHTHAISDVTNLQNTLNNKAAVTHTHTVSQITDLNLGNYATKASVSQAISDATFNNGHNAVSSVSGIPVSKRLVIATISNDGSFTLASTPADGREIHVIVHNTSGSDIEITMPSGSNYVKMSGDTLTVAGSSYADINVISDGTKMYIRAL